MFKIKEAARVFVYQDDTRWDHVNDVRKNIGISVNELIGAFGITCTDSTKLPFYSKKVHLSCHSPKFALDEINYRKFS